MRPDIQDYQQRPSVVPTADGSKTLYCPHYKQTYHCRFGALTESQHVFINAGDLDSLMRNNNKVAILEVGFGTGLNYLLTVALTLKYGTTLQYTALEQHILPDDLLRDLDYGSHVEATDHYQAVHEFLSDLHRTHQPEISFFSFKNIQLSILSNLRNL